MSGSAGDRTGGVWLVHVWVPDEYRSRTVGPWHWWNVYQDEKTAIMQAAGRAAYRGWGGHALTSVRKWEGQH